jgi:hypothetical protein
MSGKVQSGHDKGVAIDQIEEKAKKVGQILRQTLSNDKQAQADLEEVAVASAALYIQLAEWAELHRLIHDLLVALAPFRALLALTKGGAPDSPVRQALFQNWRPCQQCVDRLADFAEEIKEIGHQLQRNGGELNGERWVVDIIASQILVEDALKEDNFEPGNLSELVEELDNACHCHLTMIDRKLKAVTAEAQSLSTSLFGGNDG